MSKFGTCKFAHQIQEKWLIPYGPDPDYSHPHTKPPVEEHIILPEDYTCQWLDQHGTLPPPIKRMNGGFKIRKADCDNCPHYAPASNWGRDQNA